MTGQNDASERYSGTKPIPQALRIDAARLADYLEANVDGFEGPMQIEQFRGGQSNPTYLITAGSGRYVLRRKPPGELLPSAHAVDREYRVTKALHGLGFPVPRPYVLCEDPDVAGTMFYVMEFLDGRVFWDGSLPDLSPSERTAVYRELVTRMAELHKVDYVAAGLEDFGRPGNYFARQISRWSKQYRASVEKDVPAMNRLMEWLPENIPADDSVSLVHGDLSLHNTLFHPTEPRILGVLDWEISTIGHPLGDLTYNMLAWYAPPTPGAIGSLQGLDLAALGIPDRDTYLGWYCEQTGRDGIGDMDFYCAYNLFRLAAILQGILGRVRDGTATNENAAAMAARVEPLSALGWEYAQRAGAS